jgi:hypothetical protein
MFSWLRKQSVNWIQLSEDGVQWYTVIYTVMNLGLYKRQETSDKLSNYNLSKINVPWN